MERDNKKARDDARKDYNETIRVTICDHLNSAGSKYWPQQLAFFIRKRDPRYKAHLAAQAQANKSLSQAKPPTSGSSTPRPQPVRHYVEQDWQRVHATDDDADADLDWAASEGNAEEWECVACGKTFRSEASWDSHERSKKHMREIEKLKREMRQEEEEIGLDAEDGDGEENREVDGDLDAKPPPSPTPSSETILGNGEPDEVGQLSGKPPEDDDQSVLKKGKKKSMSQKLSDRVPVPSSVTLALENENTPEGAVPSPKDAAPSQPELTKREKRKLREAKKAANPEPGGGIIVCTYPDWQWFAY